MRKLKCCLAAVCALTLLSGCSGGSIYSNYRELEQLMVIQTMGFDTDGDDFELSVSSGSGSGGGGGGGGGGGSSGGSQQSGASKVARLHAKAESLILAQNKIQDYSASEQLFFAHTSYIVLGSEAAEKSVTPFLDYIERSTILRLDTPLFVVNNDSASKLVLGAGGEDYDATSVLKSLERNLNLRGDCVVYSASEIVAAIDTNSCALICAIKCVNADEAIKDAKPEELTALPDGYAVIKNGRMIGHIPFDVARGVNILQNRVGPSAVEVYTDGKKATLQLDKCSCYIKPVFKNDELRGLDIKIKLSAALAEADSEADLKKLQKALSDEAKRWVSEVLDSSIELSCDFAQLGSTLERSEPTKLAGAGRNLSDKLSDIYYNVSVDASVDRSFDLEAKGA